ncbi:MAG: Mediator of RNA polymerase II transcription subunit 18 [Caeruleum heppii]|nr:MAG: Mediator of RNA polymerase II transcription subunit 18 [Caeruleum heppii]
MHELLLLAPVPLAGQEQLLKILAGIAGMQPKRVIERHLVFKPRRGPSNRSGQVGGSQDVQSQQAQTLQAQMQGDLFYMQLVGDLIERFAQNQQLPLEATAEASADVSHRDIGSINLPKGLQVNTFSTGAAAGRTQTLEDHLDQRWSLRFNDLPEVAGRRPVTSRMISSVDIADGDAIEYVKAFGYIYVSEYILEGYQVIHNNVILLLYRLLDPLGSFKPPSTSEGQTEPVGKIPSLESMLSVDPAAKLTLQASVRVQDSSKPESMTLGINELKAMKETLKGIVDLEVGDRLALDTRVR